MMKENGKDVCGASGMKRRQSWLVSASWSTSSMLHYFRAYKLLKIGYGKIAFHAEKYMWIDSLNDISHHWSAFIFFTAPSYFPHGFRAIISVPCTPLWSSAESPFDKSVKFGKQRSMDLEGIASDRRWNVGFNLASWMQKISWKIWINDLNWAE